MNTMYTKKVGKVTYFVPAHIAQNLTASQIEARLNETQKYFEAKKKNK
jgi:hypothetical protein